MNYFELYDLPISFNPDQNRVRQQFYALSKKYHPDFYINEGEEKQNEVLELSTLNNKAFQILKDPQKRLHYVLELKAELVEGENYSLPQNFLMEMMDVNEVIMDLQFDFDEAKAEEIKQSIVDFENQLTSELANHTAKFDENGDAAELSLIKDIYYRQKYLYRLKENVAKLH